MVLMLNSQSLDTMLVIVWENSTKLIRIKYIVVIIYSSIAPVPDNKERGVFNA